MEGQVNQDNRPLPDGWHKHFDQQGQNWYYVNINTSPPQITYTHPLGPNVPYSPPSHYGGPYGQAPAQAAAAFQDIPQYHAPRYGDQVTAAYAPTPITSQAPGVPQPMPQYSNYGASNAQSPKPAKSPVYDAAPAPYYSNPAPGFGEPSAYGYSPTATGSPSQNFSSYSPPGYGGSYQAHPPKSKSSEARTSPPIFPQYPVPGYEESPGQVHSPKPTKSPKHAAAYPGYGASSTKAHDSKPAGSAVPEMPHYPASGYEGSSNQVPGKVKSPVQMASSNSPQYSAPAYGETGQPATTKAPAQKTPGIPEFPQHPASGFGESSSQMSTKPDKSPVQPILQYAESSVSSQKPAKASSPSILPYASPGYGESSGQDHGSKPDKSPTPAAPTFPQYPAPGYEETHKPKVAKPSTQPAAPEHPQYPASGYDDAYGQKPTKATTQPGPSFPQHPAPGSGDLSKETHSKKPAKAAADASAPPSFPQYSTPGHGGASDQAQSRTAAESPKTTSPSISQYSGSATSGFPQYPAPGYDDPSGQSHTPKPAKSPTQTGSTAPNLPHYPSSGHEEYSGSHGQAQAKTNGSPSQFPPYPAPSYGEPPRQVEAPKQVPASGPPSFPQFPGYEGHQAPAGQSNAPKPLKSSGSPDVLQYPAPGYEQQSKASKSAKSSPQPSPGSPNMPQYPTGGYEQPLAQFQSPNPAKSPTQAPTPAPTSSGLTMAQRLYSSSTRSAMPSPSTNFNHSSTQQNLPPIHTNSANNSNNFNMPTAVVETPLSAQSQDYFGNPGRQKSSHHSLSSGQHTSNSNYPMFPSYPSTGLDNKAHHNYFESKPLPNEPLHRAHSYQPPAPSAPAQDFYHHRASTFTAGTKGNTTTASTGPKATPHVSMMARPPPPQAYGTPQSTMFPGSTMPGSGPFSPTFNQLPGQTTAVNPSMGYSSPPLPYASPTQYSPQATYAANPYQPQVPTYQPYVAQGQNQAPVARGFEDSYKSTKKAIKKIGKKVLTKSNGETALKIANGALFVTTGIPGGLIANVGSALANSLIDSDTVNSILSSFTDSDNGGDGSQLQSILEGLQSQPAADTGGVDYQAIATALVQQYQQQAQEQAQKQAQQQAQAPAPAPAPIDYAALLAQLQANSISSPQQQTPAPVQAQAFNNSAAQDANAMATLRMQQAMMEQRNQMMLQCAASSDAMGQI
ncbi:hypothetical protein BD779DRAFT_1674523 [Infundibulicybe gibba]|nr:hypothetical protein BD779DRAFT_1674523 [Infundibulicybe gibba]